MLQLANTRIKQTQSTAMHLAALGGHFEIVRLLIESGAKYNTKNLYEDTFLHIAVRHGH